MSINIQVYQDDSLTNKINLLGEFRLRYFKEFPYLYVGTNDGEQSHIAEYIANPTARLLLAWDKDVDNTVIGVAIGTLLSTETEILRQVGEPLQRLGLVPEQCYYLGEMILAPEYRSKGIGKQMLETLKDVGRELGATQFCFLSVAREMDDFRRPANHVDSDTIFHRFGFEKTDVFVTFEWQTIQSDGSIEKVANRLDLWRDKT